MPDDTLAPASARACLTLLVAAAVEDRVVDWLLSHADWQIEFSVHAVAARGPLVRLSSADEQVQGFAQRVTLTLIVERSRLAPLISALERLLAGVEGGYWVLPVERFAAFAPDGGAVGGAAGGAIGDAADAAVAR